MSTNDMSCLFDQAAHASKDDDRAGSAADFEAEAYLPHLDGLDLTLDQKHEFLRVLWDIMQSFVSLNVPPEDWDKIIGAMIEMPAAEPDDVSLDQ